MARKKYERTKPRLIIKFEEGEVSHEEMVETASIILNEILHWDYSEDKKEND